MALKKNAPKLESLFLRPYQWATRRFRLLIRAIGLGILTIIHGEESTKVLVYESRRAVLFRSAVHILPAAVSVFLIALNLYGRFIGRELQGHSGDDEGKLGALQVAAKLQELLILASVGAIILDVLRLKLTRKEGLPLGLLGADKSFTQISFFWSSEFWGAVLSYNTHRWRHNYLLVGLLIFGGVLATLAGPATAVLMIPRKLEWPAGGGIFWLNGSESELWPTNLDAAYLEDYSCSTDEDRLHNPKCPSAGYLSLSSYLSTWWTFPQALHDVQLQDWSIRKAVYVTGHIDRVTDTWTYTVSGPSANMQDAFVTFHRNGLQHLHAFHKNKPPYPESLDLAERKRFELKTQIPAVRASCLEHRPLSLEDDPLHLAFPKLDQFASWRAGGEDSVVINATDAIQNYLSARGLIGTSGRGVTLVPHSPQLLTVPLDISAGDASSLGLVLLKQLDGEDKNIAPLTCTVDARWTKAASIIEASASGILAHEFRSDRTRNVVQAELESSTVIETGRIGFHPQDPGSWKHIRIRPDWFDLLSPRVSDTSLFSTTEPPIDHRPENTHSYPALLDRILETYPFPIEGNPNKDEWDTGVDVITMEVAISLFFTDGLSRVGAHRHRDTWGLFPAWDVYAWHVATEELARTMVRRGDPVETFSRPQVLEGRNATRMMMRAKFFGYAMTPMNWFDYFSIVLLLAHVFLAIGHTLWSLWRGETAEAWDTVPELVALSQQSPPAPAPLLDNTCAGVRSMQTMGRVVRVEPASKLSGATGTETLQLMFQESWKEREPDTNSEIGIKYGSRPEYQPLSNRDS
ncbi:hypothetical protein BDW62DRAFT_186929 [Aspergillus aurantiobrunneus]